MPEPALPTRAAVSRTRPGVVLTVAGFSDFDSHGDLYYGGGAARFSFGLLVVSSPDSVDDHAGWDPARENVHAGKDSLHVSVRQSASGPVAVACVEEPAIPQGLELLHRGVIRLELPVERDLNTVSVYGDDPAEPAEVVVVLGVKK